MILLYVLFATYIAAVNVYSVMLLLSIKNDVSEEHNPMAGDGKLILSALLGGALGIYVAMFITRYKLKDMALMILLPVICVFNVWLAVIAFRSGLTFIAV